MRCKDKNGTKRLVKHLPCCFFVHCGDSNIVGHGPGECRFEASFHVRFLQQHAPLKEGPVRAAFNAPMPMFGFLAQKQHIVQ